MHLTLSHAKGSIRLLDAGIVKRIDRCAGQADAIFSDSVTACFIMLEVLESLAKKAIRSTRKSGTGKFA